MEEGQERGRRDGVRTCFVDERVRFPVCNVFRAFSSRNLETSTLEGTNSSELVVLLVPIIFYLLQSWLLVIVQI